MRECQRQKSDGTERRNHQAYGHNTPAIVTVGNRSRNKDQKKGRQKLEKTDQAEIKGIAGHFIHLPPNRNTDDLYGKGRKKPGAEETSIG